MIQFATTTAASPAVVERVLTRTRYFDEHEEKLAHLRKLVALLDARLPELRDATTWAADQAAEAILWHLEQFEGAHYRRREVPGALLGLRMGGISTSSTTSPLTLLHLWQAEAMRWLEAA